MTMANDVTLPHAHGRKKLQQTDRPTLIIRLPQRPRCVTGKKHGPVCKLTIHPDANTNPDVKWSDTITGRAMALANAGISVDLKNRWSHSEKRLVPLEVSVADAIRTVIQAGRSAGRSLIYHVTTTSTNTSTTPNVEGGPPCCDHIEHNPATDTLLSAFLILSQHNILINVLIDTGCI